MALVLWLLLGVRFILSNRAQRCSVNGVLSDACNVTCGVPQVPIFGPLLFILYINDLPDMLEFANVSLYVGDTAMLVSSRIEMDLKISLHTVSEWLKASKLTLNAQKTKY